MEQKTLVYKCLALFFLLLADLSLAYNCAELSVRLERVKSYKIYDELVQYSEGLLKDCQGNESYAVALDHLLNALETIYQEKAKANPKLMRKVADQRTRNSLLMLRKTFKYKTKYPLLYSYQHLFHVVAIENKRVGDYEYTLKYAYASAQIGKAILQLKGPLGITIVPSSPSKSSALPSKNIIPVSKQATASISSGAVPKYHLKLKLYPCT